MQLSTRLTAMTLTASIGLTIAGAGAAQASKEGHRNTALVLGAVTAYGILKKQPVLAGVAGAGALYALTKSTKSSRRHRRRPRRRVVREVLVERPFARGRACGERDDDRHVPPGWSHGRKVGWHRHGHDDDDDD